jgi:hypothetical protein
MDTQTLIDILTSESVLTGLIISVCAGGIMGLISLALINSGLSARKSALASQSWPSVSGRVVDAKVIRSASSGKSAVTYSPVITYEYKVRGEHYHNSNLSFAGDMQPADSGYAQPVVNHYLTYPDVVVYYDPANPARATLDRKIGNSWKVMVWVGVGLLSFTCLMVALIVGADVAQQLGILNF